MLYVFQINNKSINFMLPIFHITFNSLPCQGVNSFIWFYFPSYHSYVCCPTSFPCSFTSSFFLLSNAKNIYSMYFLCFLKEDFYRETFLHCLLKTDRLNFFTQLDFLTKYDFQVTVLMKQLPMPFIKVSLLEDTL